MSVAENRGSGFGPLFRLPEEVRALLGSRVLDQVPVGPIRESVEGYLAIPESRRGPNSMARTILADAIERERVRQRRPYRPIDAYFDTSAAQVDGVARNHEEETSTGKRRSVSDTRPGASVPGRFMITTPHLGADVPASSPPSGWEPAALPMAEPAPPPRVLPAVEPSSSPGTPSEGLSPMSAPIEGNGAPSPGHETDESSVARSGSAGGLRFEFVDVNEAAPEETVQAAIDPAYGTEPEEPSRGGGPLLMDASDPEAPNAPNGRAEIAASWRQVIDPYDLVAARRDLIASPAGWNTGFQELDSSGFQFLPGHLYMVHAPSGGGKTAILLELLRRHVKERRSAPGDFGPALLVSGSQSRAETYARLLLHIAQSREPGQGPGGMPTGPAVREWVRSGLASTPEHALWLEASARHLDKSVQDGMLTLADGGRDGLDVDTLVAWCDSGRAGANVGPSIVLIDDAHRLSPSVGQAAGSAEQHRLNVIRGLRRLADGGSGGAPCAVPVLFSVPTASGAGLSDRERVYAEELAAETTAILRVDHPSGSGSSTITVEKNTGGPCGWMFPVRLHKPLGSEA